MRRLVSLFSTLFMLVGIATLTVLMPAVAQQADLDAILARSRELRAAGSYPAAMVEAKKDEAAVEARFGTDHPNYATALNELALVYRAQGKVAEAEAHYKRALAIRETKLGKDHPDVATSLNNLGVVYWTQGKYAEAEAHYKR